MEKEKIDEQVHLPWFESKLPENIVNYLWEIINNNSVENAKKDLAGNISRSDYIHDKDNFFYKNVLREPSEYMYYGDWNNYYKVHVAKIEPPPAFELGKFWVNYQKKHEFNPPHHHGGEFSFVVFMKIPTHWEEQHALPISENSNAPHASDFQFLSGNPSNPKMLNINTIFLSSDYEGKMIFFPAWLSHQVFPFYGTEEERITISGNIIIP